MTSNLWAFNHPRNFWQCQPDPSEEVWRAAIEESIPSLDLTPAPGDIESVLADILGEGRFGPDHWRLSLPKRTYYLLKPLLPRPLTRLLRRWYQPASHPDSRIPWPVDSRYVEFLWEVLAQVARVSAGQNLCITPLWPQGYQYALVLTHDIETGQGQRFVRAVADLEESLGFRSSFNFVPEGYPIDMDLVDELHRRGFEVGVHGLTHDGKLFNSRSTFEHCAERINAQLKALGAVGFRAPLTIRNPEWMQALDIEYDLSFFDTDPFEPMSGGTMSIWPFFIGHFVELPYTLVQDYTLTSILNETSPRLWLEKVDFIEKYHGMALVNSHPDYLKEPLTWDVYRDFLIAMRAHENVWKSLPREAAAWWKARACNSQVDSKKATANQSPVLGESATVPSPVG